MSKKTYLTHVNITFASENKTVFAGDVIELAEEKAKELNERFALTFPEYPDGILVPEDFEQPVENDQEHVENDQEPVENTPEKPKRSRTKKSEK